MQTKFKTESGEEFVLDNFKAAMIAEGEFGMAGISEEEMTEEIYLGAWQYLVDTGLAWSLQGWFGRTAMSLIEAGKIEAPDKAA